MSLAHSALTIWQIMKIIAYQKLLHGGQSNDSDLEYGSCVLFMWQKTSLIMKT